MARLCCPYMHIPGNDGVLFRYSDLRWQVPRGHRHNRLEMNIVLKGHGEILLRDRKYTLLPGHILWIFPGQWHAPMRWSDDLEMWVAEFLPSLIRRAARGERSALREHVAGQSYCRRVADEKLHVLDRILSDVESTILDYETFNQGLQFALYSLTDAFLTGVDVAPTRPLHPALEKVLDVLNHPETGEMTLQNMARVVKMTPRRLSELFHRYVGLTLPEYRNSIRLQRFFVAFEKEPSTNLSYLALESGFGSYAQFHRVFKQYLQKSPKDWMAETN